MIQPSKEAVEEGREREEQQKGKQDEHKKAVVIGQMFSVSVGQTDGEL